MNRILCVMGTLNCGGAETMWMNIYRKIDRNRIQFDFVVHTNETCFYDEEIRLLGGEIYHCPRYTGKNHSAYKKWWKKFFQEHDEYAILHSHVRSTASIFFPIARKAGCVTIIHSHNTSSGRGLKAIAKKFLQFWLRYSSDYYFACSEQAGKWLFGKRIANEGKIYLLKNAINVEKFTFDDSIRAKKRKELGIEGNSVAVGHVGRFEEQKNHIFLIDIFTNVAIMQSNAKLILVGKGEKLEYIKNKVRELGISDRILFLQDRHDVNELLQAMDVFLFPSLYEGLPVSLIEAQAAGLPCVISDTISKEVDITDLVVRKSLKLSPAVWAENIISIAGTKRKSQGEKLKYAGYDITDTSQKLVEFYEGIMGGI